MHSMDSRISSLASNISAYIEDKEELEDLTKEEIIELYRASELAYKYMVLENKFMLIYLEKNDPVLYPMTLKQLNVLEKPKSQDSTESTSRHSFVGRRSVISGFSGSLIMGGSTRSRSIGPSEMKFRKKVLSHFLKTELLLEIMEDSQRAYNTFKKSSNGILETYKAETEEAKIFITECQSALDSFEKSVVLEGLDKISQRIPAEKWLKYMNDWTRHGQLIVQKLLLHKNNEAITLRKLTTTLKERQLLAENIHAVDFDQLTIENKNLKTKIEQRNKLVKELKKLNGWANVILSNSRYFLQSQLADINQFKYLKDQSENKRQIIDDEAEKVKEEIDDAKKKYEECKSIKENYIVPDTMEYVVAKSNLRNTYRKLKVVERRKKILDIALNACVGQMKNLLKTNKVNPKWFEIAKTNNELLIALSVDEFNL